MFIRISQYRMQGDWAEGPVMFTIYSNIACPRNKKRIRVRLGSKVLKLTCDEKCFRITHEVAVEAWELKTQEEADVHSLLHAKYASGHKSVILVADEILLLCLRFCNDIDSNIYIQRSSKSRIRLIDVKKLASAIEGYMQLDDWHAFVYRMRHSKVHFLAMENLIETTDWEQEIPRCLEDLVINGLFQTISLTYYRNSLPVSTPVALQAVM